MKLALLANRDQQSELRSKKIPENIEWILIDPIDHLPGAIAGVEAIFDLQFEPDKKRIEALNRCRPLPVFIHSVLYSLEELDLPFIRINAWPGFLNRPVWELALRHADSKPIVQEILGKMQIDYRLVPDIPGMVSPRIISMIVNEAYFTFQDGVSSKEEIDIAMKLGTNYPLGPFEWSRRIGLQQIHDLLTILYKTNERYQLAAGLQMDLGIKQRS